MNNHAKRLIRHLEALGFRRDYDAVSPARVYRHSNAPDQEIKVFEHMVDNTITAARRRADRIAEAGTSGSSDVVPLKERARITRDKRRAQREADDRARRLRAEAADREHEAKQAAARAEERRRSTEDLMQPGYGR